MWVSWETLARSPDVSVQACRPSHVPAYAREALSARQVTRWTVCPPLLLRLPVRHTLSTYGVSYRGMERDVCMESETLAVSTNVPLCKAIYCR